MKVLHLPFTYYPDALGGTETYVAGLVRHLSSVGVTSVIAAPSSAEAEEVYEVLGQRVYRFPVPPPVDLAEMYGEGNAAAANSVLRIIEKERPDVVHMHAHTRGVSALLARKAKAAGVPVVFTYHTPTVSCQRGTLLRYGKIPCDGKVLVTRCSACMAQAHGAGAASWLLALVPPPVGSLVARVRSAGRRLGALRLTELLAHRKRAFHELMTHASTVVAVSGWVSDLLVRNGVSERKVVVSRQGTDVELPAAGKRAAGPRLPIRAVMLGRLDPAKGLDVLLAALALVPTLQMTVDVYGIDQGSAEAAQEFSQRLFARESRVRRHPPVPHDEVAEVLAMYDVTLVPSQVMETGPLVVIESLAAGVPVIGSRLGGIQERVRDGIDGLLVSPADAAAWAACLTRVAEEASLLPGLAAAIVPQRTMRRVAEEMREVYQRVAALALDGVASNAARPDSA